MRYKISSVFEHVGLLLKKYNEQQQIEQNIYRIHEVDQSLTGDCKLTIQVIGKSSVFESTPQEIVKVDRLLEGFSKKDVRTITYLACEQIKKPKYKIVVQEFCAQDNKMNFKLQRMGEEGEIVKTAYQIVSDEKLINNMNQKDVSSVSYIAGYEHGLQSSEKISD